MKEMWSNLSDRDRLMLKILAAFVGSLALFFGVVDPLWAYHTQLTREVEDEIDLYEKYLKTIVNEKSVKREIKAYENVINSLDRSLIPGETPDLALPELNKIIKDLARKNKINVDRLAPRNPRELDVFSVVSVKFPVRATTEQLKNFLYDIETHERLLIVEELQVRVQRLRNPRDFKAEFVVSGLIRKPLEELEEEPIAE